MTRKKRKAPAIPMPPAAVPPAPPERGISCRHCGCRDLRVVYTRQRRRGIIRRRQCRHCGRRMLTWERETGAEAEKARKVTLA